MPKEFMGIILGNSWKLMGIHGEYWKFQEILLGPRFEEFMGIPKEFMGIARGAAKMARGAAKIGAGAAKMREVHQRLSERVQDGGPYNQRNQ